MPRSISDEQILEAAIDVVAERGYGGATTRLIAAAAGVNEVTLFRKFGNKATLLREAMLRELAVFEDAGGASYTGDVHEDLGRMVMLYQGLIARRGRLAVAILAELSRRPELRDVVEVPLRVVGSVAAVLARYQSEGVLEAEAPMSAVASLLAPLLARAILPRPEGLEYPELDVEQYVRRYVRGRTPAG